MTRSKTRKAVLGFGLFLGISVLSLVVWYARNRPAPEEIPPSASQGLPSHHPSRRSKNAYLSRNDPSIAVDALGARQWAIIDVHEHVKGEEEAVLLLKAMDRFGIRLTALMASTTYTLTLDPRYGFEGYKENNEAILAVKKKWPLRFAAFPTFDPSEPDGLGLLKDYVSRGADGIKLYLGHGEKTGKGPFHVMPLDDPRMEPVWAWAEEIQLPIVCHVNLNKYWDELLRLMEKHPYLRMNIPHFGLYKSTEPKLKRLAWLLKKFPYLYADVSFGYYTFQIEGFEQLARWRSRSRDWMKENREKILFGTDMVLEPSKDEAYVLNTLRSYLQFLEMTQWRFFLAPDYVMHGMGLDKETLSWIYEKSPSRFLWLDSNGNLPVRTKGWPIEGVLKPERPPLPDLGPPPSLDSGS